MRIKRFFIRFITIAIILLLLIIFLDISKQYKNQSENSDSIEIDLAVDSSGRVDPNQNVEQQATPVFSNDELTKANIDRIYGVSWKPEAPVKLDELRYIKVTYWGFDDNSHIGELVVHEKVGDEVVEIFKELYEAKFPIDKINLIDEYNSDDNLSMDDNNTSAFNFRVVAGTDKLSKHSYGLAIDINPVQNPYIKGETESPEKGKEYLNRDNIRKGMIVKDGVCYKAFIKRGWVWGGEWETIKDYQHFQKDINLNNN